MMQYDVKSYHASASGNAVTYAVRLKGVTVTSGTVSSRNMVVTDPSAKLAGTYSQTTTTITVTSAGHGLTDGQRVFLDFTSGTARDGSYAITYINANSFSVTSPVSTSTSGNVNIYTNIYVELDTYNNVGLPVKIPGEGIYCSNGIFVGVGSSVTATVTYG
jgi:hypothetical protein